jgi:predicted dehydrogenase/threonine dehydrogenase-like Zn-dependent dehydrogenase
VQQVAQNYKNGELRVLDVPQPSCRPGGVLVRSLYSLISTGTEVMKVTEANLSLLGKARARPDQVRKLADSVAQQGLRSTYAKAMNQLDSYSPLGYSLCGVVEEVGAGAEELKLGQLVACAGNEYALHAEVNWVPRNLCAPVPDGVEPRLAAFATVGAIAMHGVRRAEPQLGDTACVVGLGLVGQLTVQLLVASGVRVVGLDPAADRCRLAEQAGAVACDAPDPEGLARIEGTLADLSGGIGADHVLLVAGGSSNGPVEAAARLARDRARVVDVGKLKLDLPWNAYYEKELDVRFSRSYGPGRYDDLYELEGVDYPVGYVRWTERRNLQCFLDLLARGALSVDLLVSEVFDLARAPEVYDDLRAARLQGVGYLFCYPDAGAPAAMSWTARGAAPGGTPGTGRRTFEPADRPAAGHTRPAGTARRHGALRIGFVGAGNYASSMLLPHLAGRDDVTLARVATNTSLSAANAQRRFGFAEVSTDAASVLEDGDLDAVFVVTRHHAHAELVCRALTAGRATFVEKPLALDGEQLARILDVAQTTGNDRLMVGFNRRFAPLLTDLKARFGPGDGAAAARYLVNAGTLSTGSWYADAALEGSRFAGEGGHFIDTVSWWLGARPLEVHAMAAGNTDDLHVAVRHDDGSVATVDYVTHGNPRYPKETFEASAAGRTARLDNFTRATVWAGRRRSVRRAWGAVDKGQRRQLDAFLEAVRTGGPMPIPLASLAATTAATLAVGRSLAEGRPVAI